MRRYVFVLRENSKNNNLLFADNFLIHFLVLKMSALENGPEKHRIKNLKYRLAPYRPYFLAIPDPHIGISINRYQLDCCIPFLQAKSDTFRITVLSDHQSTNHIPIVTIVQNEENVFID